MAFLDFATANGVPVPGGTAHEPSTRPHKEAGTESSGEPSVFSRLAIALGTTLTLGLTGGHTATDSDETLVGGNRGVSKASTGRFNQPSADDLYFSHVGGRSKRIQPPPRIPAPPCISPAKGARHSERAMSTLFGELPSAALAGDNFSVDYIKAFGQGGMSLTFLGRIIFPSRKEKGDFVFIKKLLRKNLRVRKNYSELRAYERLASASGTTEHSKYLKFVAGLQAFICRPKSLSYMLLFNLHACDLWAALFAEPVRFPVRDMGSHLYKWLAQIASGIHGLHGVGIIHRDLKPENVLIDWNYDARITDLGLAFVTETQQALDYTKSYCSQFCGTIDYMAPEVRAIGESFERDQVKAWRESDPEEIKGEVRLYGAAADWASFGYIIYLVAACAWGSPVVPTKLLDKEAKEAIRVACNRFHVSKPPSAEPFRKVMQKHCIPKILDDLLLSLWAPPSIRGDYHTCYRHEFFRWFGSGPIFDILPDLSKAMKDHVPIPEATTRREIRRIDEVRYVRSNPKAEDGDVEMCWINPNTGVFDVMTRKE